MKTVAAIVTEYRRHSHGDVIVGKILEGYRHDGGPGPALKLASLYTDQLPDGDTSRALAKKFGFRLSPTIADALTLGTDKLAVDGVLIIGEHGKYPTNERGQLLYPRRRFFAETATVFEKAKRAVPVFNDKHLSATWEDAKWVYDRARELMVPLLAGSSIPLTWRKPALKLEKDTPLTAAVQLGYGPEEGYGFHALEAMQCMAERRKGGETGVKAVQAFRGQAMWDAVDAAKWAGPLLDATLKLVPAHAAGDVRKITMGTKDASVWMIEYRDGFRAAVCNLNGWIHEGDGGPFIFAGRVDGRDEPVACQFYQQLTDPFGHFIQLVKAIESLVSTGHPGYPAERTLLTTGILDAAMTSLAEKGRRIETPHLEIAYKPTDWPFATGELPEPIKR